MESKGKRNWDAERSEQAASGLMLAKGLSSRKTGDDEIVDGLKHALKIAMEKAEPFRGPIRSGDTRAYIPWEGLHEVEELMDHGETFYPSRDWRSIDYKEHLDHMWDHAAQLVDACDPLALDPDSGKPVLIHAAQLVDACDPLALDPDSGKPVLIHVAARALMTWCAAKKQR